MNKGIGALILISLLNMVMLAESAEIADNVSAAFIQRTMKQLAESTADNPARVRVQFYGQSITAQPWTRQVKDDLHRRFPVVQFKFHNPAIGGFKSPALVRTAEHDLYPWYPDLLIFHVYGPIEQYEEIIRKTRKRTTAEILLWTDHVAATKRMDRDDSHSAQIRNVAKKYDCMLVDVRTKWKQHLEETDTEADDLLRDSVHLNQDGCDLLAKYISEELVRIPELGDGNSSSGRISTVEIDSPAVTRHKDGTLQLRFHGNRVDAIAAGASAPIDCDLNLDGKQVAEHKELWGASRPSKGPDIWMPAIKRVSFDTVPVAEEWTLTALPDSSADGKRIHFKVSGSVTGDDGEGWSDEPFVSNSGRVVIKPADWHIAWPLQYRQKILPEGFTVTWKTYPLHAANFPSLKDGESVVLAQGMRNCEHTLTISPADNIQAFRIYRPGMKAEDSSP